MSINYAPQHEGSAELPLTSVFPDRHEGHFLSWLEKNGLPFYAPDEVIIPVMEADLHARQTTGITDFPDLHR